MWMLYLFLIFVTDLDYTQDELPSSSVDTAIDPREELQMTVLPSSSKGKVYLCSTVLNNSVVHVYNSGMKP